MSTQLGNFLHYRLDKELGGNMARVLKAYDTRHQRTVALKLILDIPDKAIDIKAENNGAAQQQRLSEIDPRVPKIYEYGAEDGYFYVAMEYIEGEDLSNKIALGPIPAPRAVKYAIEILRLIESAEKLPMVHGDFKPGNIRITPKDEMKVLDYGIAKALSGNRKATRNQFFTPAYSSPERINDLEMSVKSDLWSIGVMLYEMISGSQPFQARNDELVQRAVRTYASFHSLRTLPNSCPKSLQRVIEKAMSPRPSGRYATPASFRADLERVLNQEKTEAELSAPNVTNAETVGFAARPNDSPTKKTNVPLQDDPPTTRTFTQPMREEVILKQETASDTPTRRTSRELEPLEITPPPPAPAPIPPAPQRQRADVQRTPSRWPGRFFILVLLGVLGYAGINEYGVWQGIKALEPEIRGTGDVQKNYDVFQIMTNRSWIGRIWKLPGADSLKSALVARADGEIGRYRNSDTADTVKKANWQQAELCLKWAMDLGRDSDVDAKHELCEGHVMRLDKKPNDAIRKFENCAKLKPNWPDPYIGLARVYSYDLKDPKKAMEANKKAAEFGHSDTRTIAFDADNYLRLANRLFGQSRNSADNEDAKKLLTQAKENCQEAVKLYTSIIDFGYARTSLSRARALSSQIDEKIAEIESGSSQDSAEEEKPPQ